jgi:hypothetical protein
MRHTNDKTKTRSGEPREPRGVSGRPTGGRRAPRRTNVPNRERERVRERERERERDVIYIGSKSLANYNLRMMKNIPDHRDLVDPDTWNNDCRCGSCFVGPVSLSQIIVTLFGSGRVYIYTSSSSRFSRMDFNRLIRPIDKKNPTDLGANQKTQG